MSSLDREGIGLLNALTDSNTFFVLSSSWRKFYTFEEMVAHLKFFGWTGTFHEDWCTADFDGSRGEQIQEWLNRHPEVDRYVIFDDDPNIMKHQKKFWCQTLEPEGISWKNMLKAVKILFNNYQEWRVFYHKEIFPKLQEKFTNG
jgi:hypothetical protein